LILGKREGSCGYPVLPAPFFEEAIFSIMCFGLLCQRSVGCRCVDLSLILLLWPSGLLVCFCASTMLMLLL
jgi:hypothetical protein